MSKMLKHPVHGNDTVTLLSVVIAFTGTPAFQIKYHPFV